MTELSEEIGARAHAGGLVRAALFAWAVPGAGHIYLGKKRRGAVFATLVLAALWIGWSLDGNLYAVVTNRPLTLLATLASMGVGLPYFGLRYLLGYAGEITAPGYEYGSAFILTAGLMNLLLVLDCCDLASGHKE
ncbi:MAG: hypothetical protein IH936_11560 [Acidobacteria bacterium]|nr:hypothetical protein [Acidobacteriota bacterium]